MNTGTGAKVAQNPQQNVRASERFDLEVQVDLESDHNFYTGLTQNISAGGLFIATNVLRRIGDRITLKFSLPGIDAADRQSRPRCAGSARTARFTRSTARRAWASGSSTCRPKPQPPSIQKFLENRDSLYYDDE